MMTFMQFLLSEAKRKSVAPVSAASKPAMRLLPDFASFKQWLTQWPDALSGTGIKLADVKKLYAASRETGGSMPEPVVADYSSSRGAVRGPGTFALRKWTSQFLPGIPDGIRGTSFAGFHNTALKTPSVAKPGQEAALLKLSGEKMESVICYAWNYNVDMALGRDPALVADSEEELEEAVTEYGGMDDATCAKYYSADQETFDQIVAKMREYGPLKAAFKSGQYLDKLPATDEVTDTWKERGEVDGKPFKPSNVPKTDIITSDGKVRISLKGGNGQAQIMSGVQGESVATLFTALLKTFGPRVSDWPVDAVSLNLQMKSKPWPRLKLLSAAMGIGDVKKAAKKAAEAERVPLPDNQTVLSVIDMSSDLKQAIAMLEKQLPESLPETVRHDFAAIRVAETDIQQRVATLLVNVMRDNPDFIRNLAYEAASGEEKFGRDSKSTANTMLVWNTADPSKSAAMSMREYIDELAPSITTVLGKEVQLNFKANGGGHDMTIRLLAHPKKAGKKNAGVA